MDALAGELLYASSVGDAFASLCVRDARSFDSAMNVLLREYPDEQHTRAKLFVVFDGAGVPTCVDYFEENALKCHCLLPPEMGHAAQKVAPHVAEIPNRSVLRKVFRMVWGRRSAIFVISTKTSLSLSTHFRECSVAQLPNGELGIFRFFDPFIFKTFLEIIDTTQYTDFFTGFVERALFEDQRTHVLRADFPANKPQRIEACRC